jgi:triosephosphate isomerase
LKSSKQKQLLPKIFVANWKMNKSYDDSLQFAREHRDKLANTVTTTGHTVILCPNYLAIAPIHHILGSSGVALGAQNCSRHGFGSYTGDTAASSLAQAGCSYVIIGHSERRRFYSETNIDIEHKLKEALKAGLVPIICIGETAQERAEKRIRDVLSAQLEHVLEIIATTTTPPEQYIIAYEPVWAIGSGTTPEPDELQALFHWLAEFCNRKTTTARALLYGGSVRPENAASLLAIPHLDGLLIGSSSLSYDSLHAIITAP